MTRIGRICADQTGKGSDALAQLMTGADPFPEGLALHARGARKKPMADISTTSTNAAPSTQVSHRFSG